MGASIGSLSYGMQPELRPVGALIAMQVWVSKDPSDSWPQLSCSWQIIGTYSLGHSSMGKIIRSNLVKTVSHTWLWDLHLPSQAVSLGSPHTRGPNSSGRPGQGTKGLAKRTLSMLSCHSKPSQPRRTSMGPPLIISQRLQRSSAVAFGNLQSGISHHLWHGTP